MSRRAPRASKETYLRQKMDNLKVKRKDAITVWAEEVFKPKYGRYPSPIEQCAAADSGEIGRFVEDSYSRGKVVKREIVVGNKTYTPEEWCKKPEKIRDTKYSDEMVEYLKDMRHRQWKENSETETIKAAIAGTLRGTLEEHCKMLFEKKESDFALKQVFDRVEKSARKRKRNR